MLQVLDRSMTDGPYCRVYWSVMSDEKFDGIRENPTHLGSWLTLLLVADMAWPAPAFIPPTLSKRVIDLIEGRGLIEKLPGWRFRVTGLDAERASRKAAARVGGLASGRSRSVERPFNDRSRTTRTETNLAEQSRAEQSISARDGLPHITAKVADEAQGYTGLNVLAFGDKAQTELDRLVERHGETPVRDAFRKVVASIPRPSPNQLVFGAVKVLEPFLDTKTAAKADREAEEQQRSRRGVEATLRQNHRVGGHEFERRPGCPMCDAIIHGGAA